MFFVLGRTQKILDELMLQMFSSTTVVDSLKFKEGNFFRPLF